MNVPYTVAKLVYEATSGSDWGQLSEENQGRKISKVKKMLNNQVIEKMTIDRVRERGGFDDIHNWLKAISQN